MPAARRSTLQLFVVASLALVATRAIAADDAARTITLVFGGPVGAVAGDVNADGRADAADVTGALLGLRSPTQPGPFGIGVRQIPFTKTSASHPREDRVLLTDVWYPTAADAAPLNRKLGGVVGAPLAAGAAHLPLLIFSHGSCGYPEQSLFLTTLIASYGFVVAAPPHPGNTLDDLLAGHDCQSPQALASSFIDREPDIQFVIDSLLALTADPTSFLFGAIDPERIGMSGHSFGGQTTLRICADDPRVIAGLALAPALRFVEDKAASIHIPMIVENGEVDTLTPFAENALPTYNLLAPPRYLLEILKTGHYAFSDGCYPGPDCGPDTLTQSQAHLYVLRFTIPYVLHYVAHDTRFDDFLRPAAAPPGAVLTADADVG